MFFAVYLQRLEKQTRNMDSAQYADFCESRQLSFCKYRLCCKYILYNAVQV